MAAQGAYGAACIELYSRLWAELDVLSASENSEALQPAMIERSEILRLEIHILIDACDTARWRLLLNTAQRHNLKSTLHDVLLSFGMCTGQFSRDAIASAQNCLLDAVLEHCARNCRALEHLRRAAS